MNCSLPKITYPTLRTLLLLKLHEAIILWGDVRVLSDANRNTICEPEVPKIVNFGAKDLLKRVVSNTSIATYLSPIALKLSAANQQPLPEVLRHLAELMRRSPQTSDAGEQEPMLRILRDITVEITEAGILEFKVSDRAIATWLKFLIDTKLSFLSQETPVWVGFMEFSQSYRSLAAAGGGVKPLIPKNTQNTDITDVEILRSQVAHARCGSLLRLVPVREIVWLEDGRFRLTDAAARGLLSEIISVLDGLSCGQDPLKLLKGLTLAFEKCDRECQFGTASQLKILHSVQCRLGLVMITQVLLNHILEDKLGCVAPQEL
jgi:hypothetical protein